MAKKGQTLQLQTEINTDEEWEKFLQRDGLLIVDVYSDWCGPCSGMTANLKKLKLEIGGDLLQLGIAKCDHIEALKRFRNKSEPTWLFIANGKLVNLMFGANAPKLIRMITQELKNEQLRREGQFVRSVELEITEMAEEEKERYEAAQAVTRAEQEVEEKKRREELHERRVQECLNIAENLSNLGVIIVFPHAKERYAEVLMDVLGEAGLVIGYTDKRKVNAELLEEMMYFVDEDEFQFPAETEDDILNEENETLALLIKQSRTATELETPMDEYILHLVYGSLMRPPGSPDSPAKALRELLERDHEERDTGVEMYDHLGMWCPPNEMVKSVCLKLFFKKLAKHYLIDEPEPTPDHLAVIFDVLKRQEIWPIMQKYPNEVMRYGFFTSEIPEEAELVAKSMKKYEHCRERTFKEKLIIQLSKKKSECLLEFAQARPLYISPNAQEGKRQCKILFPDDYDEPPVEDEEDLGDLTMMLPADVMSYLEGKEADEDEDELEDEEDEEDEEEEDEEEDEEEEEGDDQSINQYGSLFGSVLEGQPG